MTNDLKEMLAHPALNQMLKYSFVGNKQTVKKQILDFIEKTKVNELIVSAPMYATEDRLKSTRLFAEVIKEINLNKKMS